MAMFERALQTSMRFAATLTFLFAASCRDATAPAADSGTSSSGASGIATAGASGKPATATSALADGVLGSSCNGDSDCGAGHCITKDAIAATPYPGGYCSESCSSDAQCGALGSCAAGFLGNPGNCFLRCDTDSDCRDGYRCREVSGVGRCIPGAKPLPDHSVGQACNADSDCGGVANSCAAKLTKVAAPGGYCSETCAANDDCGADGVCISGINIITLSIGTCYRACNAMSDCRDGYLCHSLTNGGNLDNAVCAPELPSEDAGVP
jgi:hypothetical protein